MPVRKTQSVQKAVQQAVEAALSERDKKAEDDKLNAAAIQTQKEIIANLEELGGKNFADEDIIFEGDKLMVPATMTLRRAHEYIGKKMEEEEADAQFSKTFNYRPWDGAWCTHNVLRRVFGSTTQKATQGFFGPNPPQMITIPSGIGTTVNVPWGAFELPALEGMIFKTTGATHAEKGALFRLSAEGPKKHRFAVEGIFNLIAEELATNSLYRGKAFDGQEMPEFVDVYSVDPAKVVYSETVMDDIEVNIWTQIRYPEAAERRGMSPKRAVLLHGQYGTGKTLACMLTGQQAIANGWTFIKARPGRDVFSQVLQTARLYQPAVVFYEDVDIIVDGENTDRETITRLLDDFDGVDAKGTRILAVLTTNFPDRIHGGMVRPGRLDSVIEIGDLDQDGVRRLVESRLGDLLEPDIDWETVFIASQGYKPAFVTEFADRTMRWLLSKHGQIEGHTVSTYELVRSAESIRAQYNMMIEAKDVQVVDPLGAAHKRTVEEATAGLTGKLEALADYVYNQ